MGKDQTSNKLTLAATTENVDCTLPGTLLRRNAVMWKELTVLISRFAPEVHAAMLFRTCARNQHTGEMATVVISCVVQERNYTLCRRDRLGR